MSTIVLKSVLTCPRCSFAKPETMPTDACQFYYECSNCKAQMRPQARELLRSLLVRLGEVPPAPLAEVLSVELGWVGGLSGPGLPGDLQHMIGYKTEQGGDPCLG